MGQESDSVWLYCQSAAVSAPVKCHATVFLSPTLCQQMTKYVGASVSVWVQLVTYFCPHGGHNATTACPRSCWCRAQSIYSTPTESRVYSGRSGFMIQVITPPANSKHPNLKPSFWFLQVRLYIWHSRTLMWYDKITQQTQNKYLSGSFFSEPLFKNFALYKQSLHLLFGNISNDDLYTYRFKCVLNFVSGKCT